jgi:hypothetical protein
MISGETKYYDSWTEAVQTQPDVLNDPASLALLGGSLTTEPAFIFIAGYQAAIRAAFPEVSERGWVAYAASEDRDKVNPKPGVVFRNDRLHGFKTWLAMSRCVDQIIVRVNLETPRYVLTRPSASVSIYHKENVHFLSGMSQGIAEFVGSPFDELTDLTLVRRFSVYEPYYIYLAFLSSLDTNGVLASDNQTHSLVVELIEQHRTSSVNLIQLDTAIQQILTSLPDIGRNWETDRNLFSMYSRGIQARA